jgi:uncharacterized protein (TIGR02266 family)
VERKKVLLADDVELFLEMEKTFFRREMFDLLVARTGQQAYEMAVANRPDLVFMDLYMPEMNGDEACRRIKSDPRLRPTPVVMVSPAGLEDDLARCREAGCDDILLKPINRNHFLAAAGKHLKIQERTAPRFESRLAVQYGRGSDLAWANLVNLSVGGIFIETRELLPPGEIVSLAFTLPEGPREIFCSGRVAWVNSPGKLAKPRLPFGVGVQFVDLAPDDMEAISEHVKGESLAPRW